MIDQMRVEDLLHEAQRASGIDAELMLDVDTEALPLLTDYLALRGIVEALAASKPFGWDAARNIEYCEFCGVEVDGTTGITGLLTTPFAHQTKCPYACAVALVGPAGGELGEALTDQERDQIVRSIRTSQALSGVEGTEEEVRAALEQAEKMPRARIGE